MTGDWVELEATVPTDLADAVCNFCHEHDSEGVVIEEAGEGQTTVKAYFDRELWPGVDEEWRRYARSLQALFPDKGAIEFTAAAVRQENWAVLWQDRFQAMEIGKRLLVTPPWLTPDPGDRLVIVIEPAEAFGTGTHETTQGCLVLLEEAAELLNPAGNGFSLLDAGCGSGILAIAGARLGANPVLALDNDPVAVQAAKKNGRLNDVSHSIRFEHGEVSQVQGSWDVVTANLDPLTLDRTADRLMTLCRHILILSGVPVEQWSVVRDIFLKRGLISDREILGSEWTAAMFTKPESTAG